MSRVTTRLLCLLGALLVGTLGALVSPRPAYACECAGVSTSRALRNADAVFRGTVTRNREIERGGSSRIDIRFRVSDVFKGTVYADQVVASTNGGAACGLNPEVGSEWIIFATDGIEGTGDQAVNRLVTSLCSGNLVTDRAPAVLGRPRPPLAGASDREERSVRTDQRLTRGVLVVGVGVLGLGALMSVGLALVWRRGGTARTSAGPER